MKKCSLLALLLIVVCSQMSGKGCAGHCCSAKKPLVILFDNDVHCNYEGYTRIAALRDAIVKADTAYCAVVSCGDFIQGGTLGTLSKGQYLVDITNAVGYTAMALGNHEFDFGFPRLQELSAYSKAPFLCLNLTDLRTQRKPYPTYVLRQFGRHKVAFMGILTPNAMSDERSSFIDSVGQPILGLTGEGLYEEVQQQVNNARRSGADYVILLSHLSENDTIYTTPDLIRETTGIDAVLDGHSHSLFTEWVKNRQGKAIPLAQTGALFANIGQLVLTPHRTTVSMIPTSTIAGRSPRVDAVIDSVLAINRQFVNQHAGYSPFPLLIDDERGQRIVRVQETNSGDFVADAIQYVAQSQIAIENAGGIRKGIGAGAITYQDVIDMLPFPNFICKILAPGSAIRAALAYGASNVYKENGFFAHVAGCRYEIYPDSIQHVGNIEVLNSNTGQYEALDPTQLYTVGISIYNLSQYGNCFAGCPRIEAQICMDYEAAIRYMHEALHDTIPMTYSRPQGRIQIRK